MDKIVFEKFDSIEQFASVIGRRPLNDGFAGCSPDSQSSDYGFTGTKTYDESVKILKSGYKEGLEKINKAASKKAHTTNPTERTRAHSNIVGFAPIVPNAILGIPQSMISKDPTNIKAKVISIVYGVSTCSSQSVNDIVRAGANIMGLIRNLELQGYRVELRALKGSYVKDGGDKWYAISSVKLKTDRQPANPLKIAYAMIHPSYSRRQCFRWLETHPEITTRKYSSNSYGITLYHQFGDSDSVRSFLKEKRLLNSNEYYIDMNEAMENSPDNLMGILKKINKNFR